MTGEAATDPPTVLRFVVRGEPVGKGRARTRVITGKGKPFATHYTPTNTRTYENTVRTMAQIAVNQARWSWAETDEFAVVLKIFHMHKKRRPDVDNVFKSVADACNGVAWRDDADIKGGGFWRERDHENPRVEVEIRRLAKKAA